MPSSPPVGLSLDCGLACGPAHIGVLKVLTQAGIPVDRVEEIISRGEASPRKEVPRIRSMI